MNRKMHKHWKLDTDENSIVWCHIDVKGSTANVLSGEVLDELNDLLDSVAEQKPSGMIILSDKTNGFIAGADVKEFTTIEDEKDALRMLNHGQTVFNKLEDLKFPTLCLINGFCLGLGRL